MQDYCEKAIEALRKANHLIALAMGVMLFGCAAFILTEIAVRQLGGSLGGTDEISGYVMAIFTSWGMAYCLLELGHVRIDVLRGRLTTPLRAVLDIASLATFAAVICIAAYRCWPVVERSLLNGSRANTPLETPLALVQIPWFAGWVWFGFTSVVLLLVSACLLIDRQFDRLNEAVGVVSEEASAMKSAKIAEAGVSE